MATNTTESGIEESDDSSTGRRQVLSARMWLFFCGVFCLSTVGCTFIWTKYKRNQRIASEVLRLEMAITSESKRKKGHKDIVKKATSVRLQRVLTLSSIGSNERSSFSEVSPLSDNVVVSSTELEMESLGTDIYPQSPFGSTEEASPSNELNLQRNMSIQSDDLVLCGLEMGAHTSVGGESPAEFCDARVKSATDDGSKAVDGEYKGETHWVAARHSQHYFDEVEGAVAADKRGTATDARVLGEAEDDTEALYTAVPTAKGPIDKDGVDAIAAKRKHVSWKPGIASANDKSVGKVAVVSWKPDGARSGLRREREDSSEAKVPECGSEEVYVDCAVSAVPSLTDIRMFSEGPSSGFAALRQADIEHSLVGGSAHSGESLRIAMPSLASMATAMHSEGPSTGWSRLRGEGRKKRAKSRKKKKKRKKKRKKAAVDLSLLEASAEQRSEWRQPQWDEYYRAYECRYPEAYRQLVASTDAGLSPRTATSSLAYGYPAAAWPLAAASFHLPQFGSEPGSPIGRGATDEYYEEE